MVRALLTCTLLILSGLATSQAQACAGGSCSTVKWANDGSCYEWTPSGVMIEVRPNHDCRVDCGVVRHR
jgi:hypothetical protein